MNVEAFRRALQVLELSVDDALVDAFTHFEEALYTANEVMNLTRIPREEAWLKHFVDSLLFHSLIPNGAQVLDIGSGPGFPAWPLARARPDLRVTALDSSSKMLGFLANHPLSNLEILVERAESWPEREKFDVVTGRALAPLAIQLELSARPCRKGGCVIPMRTPADLPEIERLAQSPLHLELERIEQRALPETAVVRVFPVFRKKASTPRPYPRPWAEIRRKPL